MTQEELLISRIASYCYCTGALETENGNYIMEYERIAEYFNLPLETIEELKYDIFRELNFYVGISDVVTTKEGFDINYYTAYCSRMEEEEYE